MKQHKKYDRLNIMHQIYEQAINKVGWTFHENETCSTTTESIQPTKNLDMEPETSRKAMDRQHQR